MISRVTDMARTYGIEINEKQKELYVLLRGILKKLGDQDILTRTLQMTGDWQQYREFKQAWKERVVRLEEGEKARANQSSALRHRGESWNR